MADLMYTRDLAGNQHIRVADRVLPVVMDGDPKPLGSDRGNIRSIQFDGVIGTIERTSAVPGRVDIEHFLGDDSLVQFREAYATALAAAEAKREAVRKAHEDAQVEAIRVAKAQQDEFVARAAEAAAAKVLAAEDEHAMQSPGGPKAGSPAA